MTHKQLAAELLAIPGKAERDLWLDGHRPHLSQSFVRALRAEVAGHILQDPPRAFEMAAIAVDVASTCDDPLAMAEALWARGNVLNYRGDWPNCLEDYQVAEVAFAHQGDVESVACLQNNRVWVLINQGELQAALILTEVARQGLEATGHAQDGYMAFLEMNVGVARRQTGRYEEALAAYERGRAIFEGLGNRAQVARMDINRALVMQKMDRFVEAMDLLASARSTLAELGAALDLPRVDLNLAHIALLRGHYRQALDLYARAREGFAATGNEMDVVSTDFYRCQVYLALNLFAEANELAGYARQGFLDRGMARYATQAVARQAAATRGLGHTARALDLYDLVRTDLEERGETLEMAFLDLQRIPLLHRAGELQLATQVARSVVATFEQHNLGVRLVQANLTLADCLLEIGHAEEARALYGVALQTAETQGHDTLLCHVRYGLGKAAEGAGDRAAAMEHYQAAVDHLEVVRHDLRVDEFQAGFLDDKLDLYESVVRLALEQGDVPLAFEYVERARSGTLLDLLARSADSFVATGPDELLARIQALREQWHWHASQLEGLVPGEEGEPVRATAAEKWTELRDVEHQLAEAWRLWRLRQATSEAGENRPPESEEQGITKGQVRAFHAGFEWATLSLPQVQARLSEDTVIVEYLSIDDWLFAFLVRADKFALVDLNTTMGQVEQTIDEWRFDLGSLRLMLPDLNTATISAMEADGQLQLERLYDLLVGPLVNSLSTCHKLIVVPHQALHYLPFSALHDGQQYLLDRFQIHYLPGASLLSHAVEGQAGTQDLTNPLILAHSAGGQLPHTLEEAQAVAGILAGARVFVEDEAVEVRLRKHGPTCGLLHLATHGTFRADNPFFSWLHLADTRLIVRDLYDLRLPLASLVTLSACETGLGVLRGGELLGLGQGFLAAGARSLLLSLWAVDDSSTAQLMAAFYRHLSAGHSKTAALQQAQQQVRQQYPHPFHWAGFVLIGDG
ncbi:MAG: CHAT domain-containing protein [Anaerolineae bacterium]|nr:CHAT domain-containing protein [Anaerolineae bacterium]